MTVSFCNITKMIFLPSALKRGCGWGWGLMGMQAQLIRWGFGEAAQGSLTPKLQPVRKRQVHHLPRQKPRCTWGTVPGSPGSSCLTMTLTCVLCFCSFPVWGPWPSLPSPWHSVEALWIPLSWTYNVLASITMSVMVTLRENFTPTMPCWTPHLILQYVFKGRTQRSYKLKRERE